MCSLFSLNLKVKKINIKRSMVLNSQIFTVYLIKWQEVYIFAVMNLSFSYISDKEVCNHTLVSQKKSNLSKPNFQCLPLQVTRSVHFLQWWIPGLTLLVTKNVQNHILMSQKISNLSKPNFYCLPWQVTRIVYFCSKAFAI